MTYYRFQSTAHIWNNIKMTNNFITNTTIPVTHSDLSQYTNVALNKETEQGPKFSSAGGKAVDGDKGQRLSR